MTSIKFQNKILLMVLIFGMAVISFVSGQDKALSGTWESSEGEEFLFNNGNFETYSNAVPNLKGTYTTNNGKLILNPTYLFGIIFNLENRWYSVNELNLLFDISEGAFVVAWDYFVRGNRLSIIVDEQLITYIKK